MIIFLAGLRQIPQDMYEAASIDGASRARQFFKITLPLLTPVIFGNAVILTIDAFKAFTPAFVISDGSERADRLDAVLYALSLSGGVHEFPLRLCLGARLGAGGDHRGLLPRWPSFPQNIGCITMTDAAATVSPIEAARPARA